MDIQIQFSPRHTFDDAESRTRLARFFGRITSAHGERPFEPYMMNDSDMAWVIDANNDWFLIFNEDSSSLVRLRHRYGSETPTRAMAEWAAYRHYGAVVL